MVNELNAGQQSSGAYTNMDGVLGSRKSVIYFCCAQLLPITSVPLDLCGGSFDGAAPA